MALIAHVWEYQPYTEHPRVPGPVAPPDEDIQLVITVGLEVLDDVHRPLGELSLIGPHDREH